MNTRAIAVISDIHGNLPALKVVLEDINRRGITNIVNLGDCCYGPLDPAGTAELLMELAIPTVRGNEDRIIYDPLVNSDRHPTLDFTRQTLHSEQIQWLKSLPLTLTVFDNCLLCHGTPSSDMDHLLYEITKDGLQHRAHEDIRDLLPQLSPDQLVFCGHSHLFRAIRHPDCPLIVSTGSVGLQAYTDDQPYLHRVAAGSPHARYTVVTLDDRGTVIEEVELSYDWDSAAKMAEENGREDWAVWLKTGIA